MIKAEVTIEGNHIYFLGFSLWFGFNFIDVIRDGKLVKRVDSLEDAVEYCNSIEKLHDEKVWRVGAKVISKSNLENAGVESGKTYTISEIEGDLIKLKEQLHVVKWLPFGGIHKSHFELI